MPQTASNGEHRFPCNQCGSDLRFDPASGDLQCDHCGNTQAIRGASPWTGQSIKELDFQQALRQELPSAEIELTRTTGCPNCGANFEFDPDVHSAECPFCATPVVTDTGDSRQIKPRALLPFALTEDTARDAMNDWLGSLWFAPNGLQEYARKGRRMSGIYVPYWTYDADTKSTYSGERGDDYYETRTRVVNGEHVQEQVVRTEWTHVRGRVRRFFDDVLVLASKSLPKKFTDALQPWDLAALEPYTPHYLAGFRAEAYQIDLAEGYHEAQAHMEAIITRDVRFDIGGDHQRIHNIDTDISDVTFKHILLPVWMAAYKYRGKTYRFVVNGRSGRVQGERPYSAWKIAFTVLFALLLAAGIGYAIAVSEGQAPAPF